MFLNKKNNYNSLIFLFSLFLFNSCIENSKSDLDKLSQKKIAFDIVVAGTTYYSESGVMKSKIYGDTIYIDNDSSKFIYPAGILVNSYDSLQNIDSKLTADSAVYYQSNNIVHFFKNIIIVNLKNNDSVWCENLTVKFDQDSVLANDFIHIKTSTQNIIGTELRSNLKLTNYLISTPNGTMSASGY